MTDQKVEVFTGGYTDRNNSTLYSKVWPRAVVAETSRNTAIVLKSMINCLRLYINSVKERTLSMIMVKSERSALRS